MWLWGWEEGAAEALSTFRSAANLCEQFDDFIFNHNESLLYEWVEEYEPQLFERIKKLIKQGKWNVTGGWYLQPDCNIPSGEGFIRQIKKGNEYFKEKFGLTFDTAVNFDSFGHSRGLVQIMSKCGYKNYLVCRPTMHNLSLPADEFEWVGYDGSEIYTRRHFELYNSALGKAAEKIENLINERGESPLCILWGVGNHGGGPSRKDLEDISVLREKMLKKGVNIIHSTPEKYFSDVKNNAKSQFKADYSLRPCNTGSYTSQILIKHGYRKLENELFAVEKMCSAASVYGYMKYPEGQLKEAETDMLFAQFHDILPGTSAKSVEQTGLNVISHGLKILSEVKLKAFFALSHGIDYKADDNYPVLVYNPHPYEIECPIECEFNLADQNWEDNFTVMEVLDSEGNIIPSQIEKEDSNLNLDWRKKVVFNAVLGAMSMTLFECRPRKVPCITRPLITGGYSFESGYTAKIDENGLVSSLCADGKVITEKAFSLCVFSDTEDPWAMRDFQDKRLGEKLGEFTLLDKKNSMLFSGVKKPIEPVRIIESGDVRETVEAVFGYNDSKAVVRYTFYKDKNRLDVFVRTYFYENDKCLKMAIPVCFTGDIIGEQSYGEELLRTDGGESVFGSYCGIRGSETDLYVLNNGNYSASYENKTLYLTLLRTPAYTGHPINDREILLQDRYTDRIDTGVREFEFSVVFGKVDKIGKVAGIYGEKPFALSFFPYFEGNTNKAPINVEGGLLTAFYYKNGKYVIRIYNPENVSKDVSVKSDILGINDTFRLNSFGFETIEVKGGNR